MNMITRLSDQDYALLQKRVLDGKEVLYGHKVVLTKQEREEWTDLYFDRCDQLLKQAILRGVFTKQTKELSPNRIAGETPDEYVERMRAKMIEEGKFTGRWAKPWLRAYRKRQEKKLGGEVEANVPTRSESYSLF